jgi:WD40 repeat protein
MSDDSHGLEAHLLNAERRQQQAAAQPQQSGQVTITRAERFKGTFPSTYWLSAAWSPDGAHFAAGGRHSGKGGFGRLQIWNGESGAHEGFGMRHLTHGITGAVISLAWAPHATEHAAELATVERDHQSGAVAVHVRSQREGSRALSLPEGLPVSQVAWSPDGTLLALSGSGCPYTALVDPASGTVRRLLDGLSGPVAWEPEGQLIAGTDSTGAVLCDAATGERVRTLAQSHRPSAVAWARHGKYLAAADGEKIRVWDAHSGSTLWTLPWATAEGDRGSDGTVNTIQWLDGGRYLLEFRQKGGASRSESGATIGSVILWDIETRSLFIELYHETVMNVRKPPAAMALAPTGRRCLIVNDNLAPVVWVIGGELPHYMD